MTQMHAELGALKMNVDGSVPLWVPIVAVGIVLLILFGVPLLLLQLWRRGVQRRGYPGLKVYLRETPRTNAEKLEAVELVLKGVVICVLGVFFPPAVLIGLVPLYYGARKVAAFLLPVPDPQLPGEGQPRA